MPQEVLTGNESVEELQRLLDVFNNRIRLIDEKKATTKPEIYQKVRGEYEAKLLEIQVLLEEKGADLQNSLAQAISEKEALLPQLQPVIAALDELELRMVIGEITEEEKAFQEQAYLKQKSEIESSITALDEKITKLNALIGKGQAAPVLSPVTPNQPAPIAQPSVVEDLPPTPPAAVRPLPPKPVASQAHPTAPAPHQPVAPVQPPPVPRPGPIPQPTAQQAPPAPTAAPKPVTLPPRAAPTNLEPPAPAPVSETVKVPTSELEELEKQFASILGSSFGEVAASPSPAMEEVLPKSDAFMEPEPVAEISVPQTESVEEESHEGELKCPKCGAYNRADNWYCEKCGNELLNAQDLFGGGK